MKILRPVGFPVALALLAWAGLSWAPAASATTSHCLIINASSNTSYTSLQGAQDGARAGGTLWVRGTCSGTADITKDLTITGQQPRGFTPPTLDGAGHGPVLIIEFVTVNINSLTVTGGNTLTFGGAGIYNVGTLTLNNVTVRANTAHEQGGAGIFNGGTVTMTGSTAISGNTAAENGGGIFNSDGTVTMTGDATITGNTAAGEGGGIYNLGALNGGVAGVNILNNTPDDIAP